MATKKVEEKKVSKKNNTKNNVKSSDSMKVEKKVKEVNSKVKDKVKKEKKEKNEEVKVKKVCPSCGKKYLFSLEECPKCGYSESKNTMYDEEDYDGFEEYDDEEVDVVDNKKHITKLSKSKSDDAKVKREKSNKKKYVVTKSSFKEQNDDLFDLFKILIIIVVLVFAVYLIIAFMNGEFKKEEESDSEKEEITATIQNEKILVSSIFDKPEKEYYVLIYDGSDENWAGYYSMIYDSYKSIVDDDVLPLFWVDLSDGFNSKYTVLDGEESNPDVKDDFEELRLKSPTLIRIKKGKNVDYYEEEDAVSALIDIIKSFNESE